MIKMAAKTKKYRIDPTRQLLAAAGLFILAALLSRGADMTAWEQTLFKWLYHTPEFLQPAVFLVTQTGSVHFLGILLIVFLLLRRYQSMLRLLLTAALAYLATGLAKDLWGRLRPHELLDLAYLDYTVRGPGFPSGHMALATALALTVARYLPHKFRWVIPVWIIGVGWSRIYLGLHAPLDIVGGFAIGWAAYALFCHVRIYNRVNRLSRGKKDQP